MKDDWNDDEPWAGGPNMYEKFRKFQSPEDRLEAGHIMKWSDSYYMNDRWILWRKMHSNPLGSSDVELPSHSKCDRLPEIVNRLDQSLGGFLDTGAHKLIDVKLESKFTY